VHQQRDHRFNPLKSTMSFVVLVRAIARRWASRDQATSAIGRSSVKCLIWRTGVPSRTQRFPGVPVTYASPRLSGVHFGGPAAPARNDTARRQVRKLGRGRISEK
jgi:hypothetical protein